MIMVLLLLVVVVAQKKAAGIVVEEILGVIPSFAANMSVDLNFLPNFNPMMLLHGEQFLSLKKPIPTANGIVLKLKARIIDILDKGKGASVIIGVTTTDEIGEVVFENEFTLFIRGSGRFGGNSEGVDRGAASAVSAVSDRKPDVIVTEKTNEDQAALYRLSEDWDPLHMDRKMSAIGGFDVPILHVLRSLSISSKHVLQRFAKNNPNSFFPMSRPVSVHMFSLVKRLRHPCGKKKALIRSFSKLVWLSVTLLLFPMLLNFMITLLKKASCKNVS